MALLEQWWEHLARRLKAHALLPNLPGEVAQAYAEIITQGVTNSQS